MNDQQRVEVFRAQTDNVRELEKTWAQVNRQINLLILAKNQAGVQAHTKILSVIYCALAEALFSKILHTPKGLELDYIAQVKASTKAGGVKAGWLKCAELAFRDVAGEKSNHRHNVLKKLQALIEQFIFDPSILRNKLAHGQGAVALNSDNTAINPEITGEIQQHTVVELYRRKAALERLAAILEDVIESPDRAHHRDYWTHFAKFEDDQRRMSGWTMDKKVAQLFAKRAHKPNS